MELNTAELMARDLMRQHMLHDWAFRFDNARRRFGLCRGGARAIQLSRHLVAANTVERVRETILHEIAHALAGCSHGHDYMWRLQCRAIGLQNARACFTTDTTTMPAMRYTAVCAKCGETHQRARAMKPGRRTACAACCRRYNRGQFTSLYEITFRDTRTILLDTTNERVNLEA